MTNKENLKANGAYNHETLAAIERSLDLELCFKFCTQSDPINCMGVHCDEAMNRWLESELERGSEN